MVYLLWMAAVICLVYMYFGYPLLLYIVSRLVRRPTTQSHIYPRVNILISVHNEADVLPAKLKNTFEIDYPTNLLQVIVVSDASTDGTDEIVRRYGDKRVSLVRIEKRSGKSVSLNEAVRVADGEILLLTDANAMLQKNALKELVKHFADPQVGFVTGWTRYGGKNEQYVHRSAGLYTRFEIALKRMESQISSCVGADGAIFAMRSRLYQPLLDHDINDFVLPLKIVRKGYRGIFEERAICHEPASSTSRQEFWRQVRITNRTLRAIFRLWGTLNPIRYGWFAVQLISHKVLRFLSPYFLVALFLSTVLQVEDNQAYQVLLAIQVLMYVCAAWHAGVQTRIPSHRIIQFLSHFVMVNLAYAGGWIRFLTGSLDSTWERNA